MFQICNKLQPSILCLTETWLDSSTVNVKIPCGYIIIRYDRTEEFKQKYGKTNGGGIAVLYRKGMKVRKIVSSTPLEETLWLEIKGKPTFIVGVVYRAEYTNLLTETDNGTVLEEQLNSAYCKSNKVIVMGDFN